MTQSEFQQNPLDCAEVFLSKLFGQLSDTAQNPRMSRPNIVLATLNAKYIHAALGLRYLLAKIARPPA